VIDLIDPSFTILFAGDFNDHSVDKSSYQQTDLFRLFNMFNFQSYIIPHYKC